MKKIIKTILISFGFLLAIFSASFLVNPINLVCSAETMEIENHNVNFYDDNKLLYSYSVESVKSLNDYDNLLTDGTFSSLNSTINSSNWVRQYLNDNVYLSGYGSLSPNNNSINIGALLDDPVSTNNTLHIVSNSGFQKAGTYTFSVNIKSATYGQHSSVLEFGYINSSGGFTGFSNAQYRFKDISSGVVSSTYILSEDTDNFAVRLYISFGTTMSIEYFRLEERSYATPYFSEQYISDLYRQENNLTYSDIVLWSTSQNTAIFDFNTPITEDINLYSYEEFVEYEGKNLSLHSANATFSPSYYLLERAIDNIEYIHYKGSLNFKLTIDTSLLSIPFVQFFSFSTNKSLGSLVPDINSTTITTQNVNSLVFNCVGFDNTEYYNFAFLGSEPCIEIKLRNGLIPQYNFSLIKDTGIVEFIVSPNVVKLNFNELVFTDDFENYVFYNGSNINDMSSKTNYFIPILSSSDNHYIPFKELAEGSAAQFLFTYKHSDFNNFDKYINVIIETEENVYKYYNIYQSNLYNLSGNSDTFDLIFSGQNDFITLIPYNSYYMAENDFGFNFTEFDIVIRKSVQRVDNSLVIFNFGYNNFLQSTTELKYQLRRGNYYYDIIYNGLIENSKMIVIDNDFIRNTLFSEYIYLSFKLDGSTTSTFDIVDGNIGTYLGFDFNFVYYTPPLIAGNSSYDLMQYRPEYMDGTPIINIFEGKFVIPFTAWIYNAFLWLIFDCPLISDLLGLIHLNTFMGALMNILNIYMSSEIGEFLMACFTFIIFWAILKSLMPGLIGSGRAIYNNTQFAYDRRRKKQDKFNISNNIKEEKYQKKLQNKGDKARRKVN